MSRTCERCGEQKIDVGAFSMCPACLSCTDFHFPADRFPPPPRYLAKWIVRQIDGRRAVPGGYLFLETDPGMGKSALLRAVDRGEIERLSDPYIVYFDARRPLYHCCRDFFGGLLRAVHSFLPRYRAESRDVSVLCAILLEAIRRRDPDRKLLILIDHLHDAPPELFTLLPAAETLPDGVYLLLSFDRGAQAKSDAFAKGFQKLRPAASLCMRKDDFPNVALLKRVITRELLHLNFKHRLTDGDMQVEFALSLVHNDWLSCRLLHELLSDPKDPVPLRDLPKDDDLFSLYFSHLQNQHGESGFVRVVTLLAALLICGVPVRPEFLPGLAGVEPACLALLCGHSGLVACTRIDGVLMIEPASERLFLLMAQQFPELIQAVADRFYRAARGEIKLRLPKGGQAFLHGIVFSAVLHSGSADAKAGIFSTEGLSLIHAALRQASDSGKVSDEELEDIWKAEIDAARREGNAAATIDGLTQLCRLHRRTGDFLAAVRDMDELLLVSKHSGADRLLFARLQGERAELLLKAGKYRAAIDGFSKAIAYAQRLAQSSAQAIFLASLFRRRGEVEQQHKLYLPMMDDFDRAVELLQPVSADAGGELSMVLLLRGRAFLLREDQEAALRDFSDAVSFASGAGERYSLTLRDLYRERGRALVSLDEARKAAASFTNAIAITRKKDGDPNVLAQLYADRAQAHELDGDHEHALADRSECIAILSSPRMTGSRCAARLAEAYLLRAQLYDRLGKNAEVIRDCSAGINRLEPFLDGKNKADAFLCISIYRQRMDACCQAGHPEQAAEDRRRIAQLKIILV